MKPFQTPELNEVRFLRKPEARAAQEITTLRGSEWAKENARYNRGHHYPSAIEWYIECHFHGMRTLTQAIEIDSDKMGGVPVLCGTRFTVSQVLAELAETDGVDDVARIYDLNADLIREMLEGMALCMQKPYVSK